MGISGIYRFMTPQSSVLENSDLSGPCYRLSLGCRNGSLAGSGLERAWNDPGMLFTNWREVSLCNIVSVEGIAVVQALWFSRASMTSSMICGVTSRRTASWMIKLHFSSLYTFKAARVEG